MLSMEAAYRAHSQTVYRYLLSLTHDAALSEELTQETFYQAVKSVDRFDESCMVSTWLCAIAKNALRSHRRKHPPTEPLDAADAALPSPETEAVALAGQAEVLRLIHLLGGEMREVVYLRLLGGLRFAEIGEILGRSENWARVTYYRGKEMLKKELKPDGKQA